MQTEAIRVNDRDGGLVPGDRTIARPVLLAAGFGVAYLVLCLLYIWVSGHVALRIAGSLEELHQIEQWKGALFVVATSLLVFALSLAFALGIQRRGSEAAARRRVQAESERAATAGAVASALAHDINNILATCDYGIEVLEESDRLTAEERGVVDDLVVARNRLKGLATRLVENGRIRAGGAMAELDLARVARDAVEGVCRGSLGRHRDVTIGGDSSVPVHGDAIALHRMALNLLLNAVQATADGGRVEVTVRRDGDDAVVEVCDDGPGIPPARREAVFTPFYSDRPGGSGLGLLSVRSCVDAHHGMMLLDESPLGGARFRVTIPARPPTSGPATEPSEPRLPL